MLTFPCLSRGVCNSRECHHCAYQVDKAAAWVLQEYINAISGVMT